MFSLCRRILAPRQSQNFIAAAGHIKRTLYSREELGIDSIRERRQNVMQLYSDFGAADIAKAKIVGTFDNLELYEQREKLKIFIYSTEFCPQDLEVLIQLLIKYEHSYNQEMHQLTEFFFGTEIMRTCHLLDEPDIALKFFQEPELKWVFEQQETYKVFLDLLFKNERYEDVYTCYQVIRKQHVLFERETCNTLNCLLFAACYKLNTPEHYKYALDRWQCIDPQKQIKRSQFFVAALALKQNDPQQAIEMIRHLGNTYATTNFLRIAIYTKMNKFDAAFAIIENVLNVAKLGRARRKPTLGLHLINDLEEAVRKTGNSKIIAKFNRIYKDLQTQNLLNDETLEERLCAEFPPMLPKAVFHKMKSKSSIHEDRKKI